jgi:phage-related protein
MGPASALARSGASSSCERANTVARVPLESFSHPWSENNSRQLGRRGCGGWVPRVPARCDLACRAVVTTGGSGYASKPARRRWRFYRTAGGGTPVREFLTSSRLPAGDRDEVLAAMKDVQINGLNVARHVRGEIFEVRASGARAAYRVLFATEGAKSQVLLAVSAFTKKTQKTPVAEIRLAERRLADWRRRGRRR